MTVIMAEFEDDCYSFGHHDHEVFADTEKGIKAAIEWTSRQLNYDEKHTPIYWKNCLKGDEFIETYSDEINEGLEKEGYWYSPTLQYSAKIIISRKEVMEGLNAY